jgi:hypothetical protein
MSRYEIEITKLKAQVIILYNYLIDEYGSANMMSCFEMIAKIHGEPDFYTLNEKLKYVD